MLNFLRLSFVASLLFLSTPAVLTAQSWQSGYAQGTAVARVSASNGASIAVYCPEGAIGQNGPSIWFTPQRVSTFSGDVVVVYVVDGLTFTFRGNWNSTGAAQVVVGTHASRAQFDELMQVLQSGNSVEAIAGNTIARQAFSLAGSSRAIGYAMSFCP